MTHLLVQHPGLAGDLQSFAGPGPALVAGHSSGPPPCPALPRAPAPAPAHLWRVVLQDGLQHGLGGKGGLGVGVPLPHKLQALPHLLAAQARRQPRQDALRGR